MLLYFDYSENMALFYNIKIVYWVRYSSKKSESHVFVCSKHQSYGDTIVWNF